MHAVQNHDSTPQPHSPCAAAQIVRRVSGFGALLLAAWLAGCGGGGGTPASGAPTLETANSASASIDRLGGTITATAADGQTYTLRVPPEALAQSTTITLTPITSMGSAPLADGLAAAILMEPSGLTFSLPATLRIGTVNTASNGKRLVAFSTANDGSQFRFNLASVMDGGLELSISHFSTAGAAQGTEQQIAAATAGALFDESRTEGIRDLLFDLLVLTGGRNADQTSTVLERWFVNFVKPELDRFAASGELTQGRRAFFAWRQWVDARARVAQVTNLNLSFDSLDAQARPGIAAYFRAAIADYLSGCANDPLLSLNLAVTAHNEAINFGFNTQALGLDDATIYRQINDCARVALDPLSLPADLTVGADLSLNPRAVLIVNGNPNPMNAQFEFTVTGFNASVQNPEGLSDDLGRYTTVYRASQLPVRLDVRACLVLVLVNPTHGSKVCASGVALQPPTISDVYTGRVTLTARWESHEVTPNDSVFSFGNSDQTFDVTLDAMVELHPLDSLQNRFLSKVATASQSSHSRVLGGVQNIGNGCLLRSLDDRTRLSTGSSSSFENGDLVSLSLNGAAYTISLDGLFGPTNVVGENTFGQLAEPGSNCGLEAPIVTPVSFTLANSRYIPGFEQAIANGVVVVNADGTQTLSGSQPFSRTTVTPRVIGGVGQVTRTVTYTFTWNLVGR